MELQAIKEKQQKTWALGNYAVIGNSLVIMGERLCEAVDVRSGQEVQGRLRDSCSRQRRQTRRAATPRSSPRTCS